MARPKKKEDGDAEIVERERQQQEESRLSWKKAQKVGTRFFQWLCDQQDQGVLSDGNLAAVSREAVHGFFELFLRTGPVNRSAGILECRSESQRRRLESLVMAALKRQKKVKTKRYADGVVVCSFARRDGQFPDYTDRLTAREKLQRKHLELQANKDGIQVAMEPTVVPDLPVFPIDTDVRLGFVVSADEERGSTVFLLKVSLSGPQTNRFKVQSLSPRPFSPFDPYHVDLAFRSPRSDAVCRVNILFEFQKEEGNGDDHVRTISILRTVCLKVATDPEMYRILQPITPYEKRVKPFERPVKKEDIVDAPRLSGSGGLSYRQLKQFKIPVDVRETTSNKEADSLLRKPTQETPQSEFASTYTSFWQNMLWISELQAYEDIKLFDMENAQLLRHGRHFKLYVAGLAENRPSVLRGDVVLCHWRNKQYRGRVVSVKLLDVILEFHKNFHDNFNVSVDRVDLVRFTFSRTLLRTSHQGCENAPKSMGEAILMPKVTHIKQIKNLLMSQRTHRQVPQQFAWASRRLNTEQKDAVQQIARGTLRPMPYIIFGPPGTGKTTTITEAVYQLARLHTYNQGQRKLKILLVAPSNDATDILVEKLSAYFPPSEMLRVLAYTRNVSEVPLTVKPYCRDELNLSNLGNEIASFRIVVSTVNLAARFSNLGVRKGAFDVVCIDEAGHATEPEVIGVVASMIKFRGKDPGQLVLAGDPNQLGPIITSTICQEYGMDVSLMERLVKTSPAYNSRPADESIGYRPELVTLLIRNYRSHPAILKLPNEMFYDSKLLACGDQMTTHSMAKWEHLPTSKESSKQSDFPVVFHSIDGENLREGNSPSWFNPQEAVAVVNYVELLVLKSRPAVAMDDIGIITPYARQVQKIRLALDSKNLKEVKVGSVETFQGQERRVIIISTVRSEQSLLSHDKKYNLGFVSNAKRFNVAITRAKALLIVVGNPRVLATDEKNWLPFLRYCRDNQSWIGDEWNEEEKDDEMETLAAATRAITLDEGGDWDLVPDAIPQGYINREE